MIDHISLSVIDYEANLRYYDKTLTHLGYIRVMDIDIPEKQKRTAGYGRDGKPSFWISPGGRDDEEIGKARGFHVAFLAPTVQAVQVWYKECLALGGKDNGAPGPRPYYHLGYYGAFIIDLNGWRTEAVLHHYQP